MTKAIRLRTGLGIVLVFGLAFGLASFLIQRPSAEYRAGYAQGSKEADAQLKAGVATIYTYGLLRFSEIRELDHDSGLHYEAIAGCMVDDRISGRAEGHNARIMQAIEAKKTPANSLLPWMKELDDLAGAYAKLSRANRPTRLVAGGADLMSPDGSVVLQAVATSLNPLRGTSGKRVGLARKGEGQASRVLLVFDDEGETELLWGPTGSNLAFVRCQSKQGGAAFLAIDMRLFNKIKRQRINSDGSPIPQSSGGELISAEDF